MSKTVSTVTSGFVPLFNGGGRPFGKYVNLPKTELARETLSFLCCCVCEVCVSGFVLD